MEHAFGLLKGRFPSLKEMGVAQDFQEIYKVVEALMVVHNICIDLDDHPEQISDFDPTDPQGEDEEEDADTNVLTIYGAAVCERVPVPGRETDAWLKTQGHHKRLHILNELCPLENYV